MNCYLYLNLLFYLILGMLFKENEKCKGEDKYDSCSWRKSIWFCIDVYKWRVSIISVDERKKCCVVFLFERYDVRLYNRSLWF